MAAPDPTSPVVPLERSILLGTPSAPPGFIRALAAAMRERHWRLTTDLTHTGVVPSRWEGDGIVTFASPAADFTSNLASTRVPCVTVNLSAECPAQPRVEPDQEAIGSLAARHLLECDCRELVWAPFTDDVTNRRRLRGYQAELHARGLDCQLLPPVYRRIGHAWNDNTREWCEAARALLARIRNSVGIFAGNDCLAQKIAAVTQEAGLVVPEQVAIVGVGNDAIDCESGTIALTSIDLDIEGMTDRAVALLDELMGGRVTADLVLHAPKGVVTRTSTNVDRVQHTPIHQAIAYVAAHSTDPLLSVALVADKVGISRRQLERGFRTLKGCTVREYIEDTRMETAARLMLEHPTSKVLAIAEATGITDPNSFFRKFRKRFGTTPAAYRRQYASPDTEPLKKRAS